MQLEIDNISCAYDKENVIEGFSLVAGNGGGEIVCLFGKSGCGKSTVLRAVAGLLKIGSGSIKINGEVLSSQQKYVAPEKRKVGMIFQDYALFPHLTALENVCFALPKSEGAEAERLLKMVELWDKRHQYPNELSGGQQQRVAIARTLAAKPDVLLMDEPFSNVDHQVRFELMKDIRSILISEGIPTLFVTHNKSEAFAFADRIAVLKEGRVAQCDTVEQVFLRPENEFIGGLLGRINRLDNAWIHSALKSGMLTSDDQETLMSFDTEGALLVRPQFLNCQPVNSNSTEVAATALNGNDACSVANVTDVIQMGDVRYAQVNCSENSFFVDIRPEQSISQGDRVVLSLMQHAYCQR